MDLNEIDTEMVSDCLLDFIGKSANHCMKADGRIAPLPSRGLSGLATRIEMEVITHGKCLHY